MDPQQRWPLQAWVPLLAGVSWFAAAAQAGLLGGVLALLPALLMTGGGVAGLLFPTTAGRHRHAAALGAVVGVLFVIPALFAVGLFAALGLGALSAAAFVAAGSLSVEQESHPPELPRAPKAMRLYAEVAADDALLGSMLVAMAFPQASAWKRIAAETSEACRLFEAQGWLDKPTSYHRVPPLLGDDDLSVKWAKHRGHAYEHVRFESGYLPHDDEPGRDRWLDRAANRTAHAWVLRGDPTRPWLMAIHGYQMGVPFIDLGAFRAAELHRELGLNVVLPVLPLHGPRKAGRISGDHFMSGDMLDTVHAEAQAMWDLRRLLGWMRAQGAPRIGVYGLSLGGYTASMLAGLDDGLDRVIAGIPATDIARLVWRHAPSLHMAYAEEQGLRRDQVETALRVISPLVLDPLLPKERLSVFGGLDDQLVPSDQVHDLVQHWDEPRTVWYPGSHITFMAHPEVGKLVGAELRALADEG